MFYGVLRQFTLTSSSSKDEMTFNFFSAFLQMFSMCDWNVNLLSKNTPNNFSQVLLCICQFSINMIVFKL